jgi:hypothetical protein
MKVGLSVLVVLLLIGSEAICAEKWYAGDERCQPPKDDGTYSAPYNALEHPDEYPVFADAGKPGWSCSYQDNNGITIQYGDSRTPQEQWLAVWGDSRP